MASITPDKLQRMLNDKTFVGELRVLQTTLNDGIEKVTALSGSKLGTKAGESLNGIESLVESVDYPEQSNQSQNVAPTLARIEPSDVPGLKDDLKLQSSEIITLASPAAIKNVLETITPAATSEITNAINKGIVSAEFEEVLTNLNSQKLTDVIDQAGEQIQQQVKISKDKLSIDLGGRVTSIIESFTKDLSTSVSVLGEFKLSSSEINEIVLLAKERKFNDAIILMKNIIPDLDELDAKTKLEALQITTFDKIKASVTPGVLLKPVELGTAVEYVAGQEPANGWKSIFTYIGSYTELEAELNSIVRPVTEVVLHWTETTTNRDIGSVEIEKATTRGIPFHYVIRRDGSVQRGRPIELEINHAGKAHEKYSISIAMVGGINTSSGFAGTVEKYLSSKSFTISQWRALEAFLKAFYNIYPGGQVMGHSDIDPNAIDPGFDVMGHVESKFGKKTVFDDPSTERSLSPADLKNKVSET
jgi:N-acetylmuramoyl-L-alanine amidase